ncbi:hypothetical protein BS47DRAFT_1365710 [Hydnum rufescens UP504]|uniref:Tetrapyrrole biosynthesis uroporphyrinogen III synthase domain-containing protein n=1 Tax=Hydnum rufescens UP504 TaxID=1448309 RepID=A0A9P6DRT6_9AGAM|nr:hypothetical protein BS47DRAFT_1365710 [Hydnum rufescens UP504]
MGRERSGTVWNVFHGSGPYKGHAPERVRFRMLASSPMKEMRRLLVPEIKMREIANYSVQKGGADYIWVEDIRVYGDRTGSYRQRCQGPMPSKAVIFCKARDEEADMDSYATALEREGYLTWFIPVLEHGATNLGSLERVMRDGPNSRFGGVIVTSARAAEMWNQIGQRILDSGTISELGLLLSLVFFHWNAIINFRLSVPDEEWSRLPFYVIGRATARALKESKYLPRDSPFTPTITLGADESGSGDKLARFIVSDYPNRWAGKPLPLLYLTGDKTTGILASTLTADGLDIHPAQVYKTWTRESFNNDVNPIIEWLRDGPEVQSLWIVFFAPSSSKAVLPTIRRHFDLASSSESNESGRLFTRVAAIGPTTAAFLREREHLRVDVVPAQPRPLALAESIRGADS